MTNPAPRPALRKAPDADTHPALADNSPIAIKIPDTSVDLRTRTASNGTARPALKRSPDPVDIPDDEPKHTITPDLDEAISAMRRQHRPPHFAGPESWQPADDHPGKKDNRKDNKGKKGQKAKERENKAEGKKAKKAAKAKKERRGSAPKAKRKGKRIDLRATMQKQVLADLRTGAKARGTSADAALGAVLADLKPR